MAQFYAEIQGNRGKASRMGTKDSGIWCHIRGWKSGVFVRGDYDEDLNKDVFKIYITDGSSGYGRKEIGFVTIRKNTDGTNPDSNVAFYPIDSTRNNFFTEL